MMRLRNGAFLVLAAVAFNFNRAAAEAACTLCQDGSPLLHPGAFVVETAQTCAEMAEEASAYSDPTSCRYYHRYGNECGCINRPPQETFCELCQDSSPIPDNSLTLEGYDVNCGVLQIDAAWNLWGTFDAEENDQKNTCSYYHHAGDLCGCPNNAPPEDGCKLCLDGSPPLMPKKVVTPGDAAEATCEAFSLFTQYSHPEGSEECMKSQSVAGSYCGCSETPTSETSTACDYCPPGLVTKEGMASQVDFKAGNKVFYFKNASCIKIALLASGLDFPCAADTVPAEFVEQCCEPATDLLGPEVFVQESVVTEPMDEAEVLEKIAEAKEEEEEIQQQQQQQQQGNDNYVIDTSTTGVGSATRSPIHDPSRKPAKLPLQGNNQHLREQAPEPKPQQHPESGRQQIIPETHQASSKELNWDEFIFLTTSASSIGWGTMVLPFVLAAVSLGWSAFV